MITYDPDIDTFEHRPSGVQFKDLDDLLEQMRDCAFQSPMHYKRLESALYEYYCHSME